MHTSISFSINNFDIRNTKDKLLAKDKRKLIRLSKQGNKTDKGGDPSK